VKKYPDSREIFHFAAGFVGKPGRILRAGHAQPQFLHILRQMPNFLQAQ
jgi:hypothetical protein